MLSDAAVALPHGVAGAADSVRMVVTWQHPVTRRHSPVGMLIYRDGQYTFQYLRQARDVDGFGPFIGMDDLDRTYRSGRLFPLFEQRLMRPSRRDYGEYLRTLHLDPGAAPLHILSRSHGEREGDGIRLFVEPYVAADGATESVFFISGVRHRLMADAGVEAALAALRQGDRLALRDEPDNPADPAAVTVVDRPGTTLGWVPSVLLPWIHAARDRGAVQVTVAAVNGPGTAPAYRLLVAVHGRLEPGTQPFSGDAWVVASPNAA